MNAQLRTSVYKRRDFVKHAALGTAAAFLARQGASAQSPTGTGARPKEAFVYTDPLTKREILQLTNSPHHSVHGYYDLIPWSPRDGRIVFTRMATARAKEGGIGLMGRAGGNLTIVAPTRRVSPNGGALAQWSADGRRIYYQDTQDGREALSWIEPDTGRSGHMAANLRMICPRGNRQVYHVESQSFSDDDVVRRRAELAVFLQDFDTGKITRLTTAEECRLLHPRRDEIAKWHLYIKHAKWAPDASRLFFVFTNEIRFDRKYGELPRVKDIYVINANGSGLRRLGEFGNHPLWHPGGKEILANCPFPGRPGLSLTLINVETGERRLASQAMRGGGHPSFSPDGRWIALEQVEKSQGKIFVVNAQTDEITLLAQLTVVDHSHQGTHLHPVWSQDSRQILVASDASGSAQLCVITI